MDEHRTSRPGEFTKRTMHSGVKTITYILGIVEILATIIFLVFNFLVPTFKYTLQNMGGVKFNPATDIPSLEGKIILVTGGTSRLLPFPALPE